MLNVLFRLNCKDWRPRSLSGALVGSREASNQWALWAAVRTWRGEKWGKNRGREGKAERRHNQVRGGDMWAGRGGGEVWFCTGAGVLVVTWAVTAGRRWKRGPTGWRQTQGGGATKGHSEGGKRPDSFSCSLPRNVLCGNGTCPRRLLQPLLWGQTGFCGNTGPLVSVTLNLHLLVLSACLNTHAKWRRWQAGSFACFHNEKHHSWRPLCQKLFRTRSEETIAHPVEKHQVLQQISIILQIIVVITLNH